MEKKITVLKGDGIGPEIVNEALKVLDKIGAKYGHKFDYTYVDIGGCSIDKYGVPITDEGMALCKSADSVLLGAVGGPKWDSCPPAIRPEKALLAVRKELGLFANLRPTKLFKQLADASPLKQSIVGNGIDLLIVRELTGGVYFGARKTEEVDGELVATDIMPYSEHEIERIGRVAFETAMKRGKKLASVDKANVLDTSRLWRKTMHRLSEEYPEVEYSDILVDNKQDTMIDWEENYLHECMIREIVCYRYMFKWTLGVSSEEDDAITKQWNEFHVRHKEEVDKYMQDVFLGFSKHMRSIHEKYTVLEHPVFTLIDTVDKKNTKN
jgi:3-isopropylmalate dehydrogenase